MCVCVHSHGNASRNYNMSTELVQHWSACTHTSQSERPLSLQSASKSHRNPNSDTEISNERSLTTPVSDGNQLCPSQITQKRDEEWHGAHVNFPCTEILRLHLQVWQTHTGLVERREETSLNPWTLTLEIYEELCAEEDLQIKTIHTSALVLR